MTIVLIFLGSVFTLFALYQVVTPFFGGRASQIREEYLGEEVREIEQLVARREVLLDALRELEFEHETNKVSEEDYQRYKRRYEREAVAIMRRLSDLHGGEGWESRIDEELEARLGRAPMSKQLNLEDVGEAADEEAADEEQPDEEAADEEQADEEAADEEAADEEAADEEQTNEEAADEEQADKETAPTNGETSTETDAAPDALELSCSNCGKPLEPEDAFCRKCGTPVAPPDSHEPPVEEVTT